MDVVAALLHIAAFVAAPVTVAFVWVRLFSTTKPGSRYQLVNTILAGSLITVALLSFPALATLCLAGLVALGVHTAVAKWVPAS